AHDRIGRVGADGARALHGRLSGAWAQVCARGSRVPGGAGAARLRRYVPAGGQAPAGVGVARGTRIVSDRGGAMELGALIERWGIRILIALVLLGALIGGAVVATRKPPAHTGGVVVALGKSDARAPAGVRVRVEVLNASPVIGLARRATLY